MDNRNKPKQRRFTTKQIPHYTKTIQVIDNFCFRQLQIMFPALRLRFHHYACPKSCPKFNRAVKEEMRKRKTNHNSENETKIAATEKA
jgi:hypothetical protein